ncbi:hypothetical protein Palpr_0207 [Paludibacter propionicigenes WB4]|uniref:DUF4199 domain-containing protein n=1 Tax=Paludibacter propionicigenes (strain DSM 17365 / JCM 13257 / WB4) TaxID=694427 RepID=E4T0Y8_PALPW|nr:DUF4199 domain-containing protein [Paludibacter propionicigenes]ADQ78369.1 hypothetical protein Palpr_0207 [Paludibacter propionicigenes WB4]
MQPNIAKSALHNFHFIGLLLSAKFILSTQRYEILAMIAIFISVMVIFMLFRTSLHFRETECEGFISYWKAFRYIFLIYLFGSVVMSMVVLIYTSLIDTKYLAYMLDTILKAYESMNLSIDNNTHKAMQIIYTPIPFSILNIFASAFAGAFWALIMAFFVRKKSNDLFDQQ